MGFAAALEFVELAYPPDDAEAVVAANMFQLAFALGPTHAAPPEGVQGRLLVGGKLRASASAPTDLADRAGRAARLLAAMDEPLRAGDVMITGSVVQVPVSAGDSVAADFGPLGRVALSVARPGISGADDR